MIDKIKCLTQKKAFHVVMIIVIIAIILFILGIIILKYSVEGETNMPFELSKITVISTCEGVDKETEESKWNFNINQNNDVYFYINKNKNYTNKEAIKSIKIDNINVQRESQLGEIKFYRPNITETGGNFKNSEENLINEIEYMGAMESDLKGLKILNQEGIIAFRCAINNIKEYASNDDQINHSELLKKAGVKQEDLKLKLIFDLTIKLESGKEYKANVSIELPIQGVVENGSGSQEITDLKGVAFKRTKN